MKRVVLTGTVEVIHPKAGILKPGVNEIHDDALAEALLAAGAVTGDFKPADAPAPTPQPSAAPHAAKSAAAKDKE